MKQSPEKLIITGIILVLLISCGREDKEKLEKKLSKSDLSSRSVKSAAENISLSGEMAKLPDIAGTKIPDVPFEASGLKFDLNKMGINIHSGIQEIPAITGVKNSLKDLDVNLPQIKLDKGLPVPVVESTFLDKIQMPAGVVSIPDIPDIDIKDIVIPEIIPVFNVTGISKDIPGSKTEVSKTKKKKKKKKK